LARVHYCLRVLDLKIRAPRFNSKIYPNSYELINGGKKIISKSNEREIGLFKINLTDVEKVFNRK